MTLAELFLRQCAARGGAPLIVSPDGTRTYGEIGEAAQRIAGDLGSRFQAPARVGVMLPNGEGYVAALFGVLLAGFTAVPIDPRLAPDEIRAVLAHASCVTLIGGPPVDRAPIDPIDSGNAEAAIAVVLPTSGSTSRPRAVALTHANLLANARMWLARYPTSEDDVVLSTLSMRHSFGLTAWLIASVAAGAAVALCDDPLPARIAGLAARTRATSFLAVSSAYASMVRSPSCEPAALRTVRRFLSGACALPPAISEAFLAKMGTPILQTYGLTEASPVVTGNPAGENRVGTVGTALDGVALAVREGELFVRGPTVMRGYVGDPAATAACVDPEGWLATGDAARIDEGGYVTILGRNKEMIVRAGEKMFPDEIEDVILAHPAVAEAAVVGWPDARFEEVPVAFVVARADHEVDVASVIALCRAKLAAFKVPRRVEIALSLPRTASGKIRRRALRP